MIGDPDLSVGSPNDIDGQRQMTLEKRTNDLIEALLQAQVSNIDPEDDETIINRWRSLIAEALRVQAEPI